MAMSRARKEEEVQAYKKGFEENEVVVVAHYSGLSAEDMKVLRAKLRENGASFKVTKNTLAKRALEGTQFAELSDLFTGPTGIAVSQDPVAAAKGAYEFAKLNDKLVIIGGAMGANIMDKAAIEQLAQLPSLDQLRGKIVGILQAPAQKLAGVTQAPAGGLARVIGAYAAKG